MTPSTPRTIILKNRLEFLCTFGIFMVYVTRNIESNHCLKASWQSSSLWVMPTSSIYSFIWFSQGLPVFLFSFKTIFKMCMIQSQTKKQGIFREGKVLSLFPPAYYLSFLDNNHFLNYYLMVYSFLM